MPRLDRLVVSPEGVSPSREASAMRGAIAAASVSSTLTSMFVVFVAIIRFLSSSSSPFSAPFIVLTAAVSVPPRLGRSVPFLYISMCSKVSRKELQKFIPMPKIGSSSRHWKFWQRFLLDIS